MRLTAIYNFKLAIRRFVSDLFEKVTFDLNFMKVLEEMDGVESRYSSASGHNPKVHVIERTKTEPTSTSITAINANPPKELLLSQKVVKGFV